MFPWECGSDSPSRASQGTIAGVDIGTHIHWRLAQRTLTIFVALRYAVHGSNACWAHPINSPGGHRNATRPPAALIIAAVWPTAKLAYDVGDIIQ